MVEASHITIRYFLLQNRFFFGKNLKFIFLKPKTVCQKKKPPQTLRLSYRVSLQLLLSKSSATADFLFGRSAPSCISRHSMKDSQQIMTLNFVTFSLARKMIPGRRERDRVCVCVRQAASNWFHCVTCSTTSRQHGGVTCVSFHWFDKQQKSLRKVHFDDGFIKKNNFWISEWDFTNNTNIGEKKDCAGTHRYSFKLPP